MVRGEAAVVVMEELVVLEEAVQQQVACRFGRRRSRRW